MLSTRNLACTLYLLGAGAFTIGINMGTVPGPRPISPLERALARGTVASASDGRLPHLASDDPMANAAILERQLADVPQPGLTSADGRECRSPARSLALSLEGRQVFVRFPARIVCQLDLIKQVSIAQPGFGPRGVGEVGAFVLGRRTTRTGRVDVSRIVVPPFRFTRDSLHFVPADLGPLEAGESFVGTYHTHPDGDIEQGVLSEVDLRFMRYGVADFHGQVGWLREPSRGSDWLFDVVDPREGQWNVYAHDGLRLEELLQRCESSATCPLDDLRLAGSKSYLLARVYTGRIDDFE